MENDYEKSLFMWRGGFDACRSGLWPLQSLGPGSSAMVRGIK